VYAHAPWLDDPQLSPEFSALKDRDEVANSRKYGIRLGPRRDYQNDDPRRTRRRETQDMTKVVI
jgi:hypothetical protein